MDGLRQSGADIAGMLDRDPLSKIPDAAPDRRCQIPSQLPHCRFLSSRGVNLSSDEHIGLIFGEHEDNSSLVDAYAG